MKCCEFWTGTKLPTVSVSRGYCCHCCCCFCCW